MVSIGRAALIIFVLLYIGIVQNVSAAEPLVDIGLRPNESMSCIAVHGDRIYVGGYYVINHKAYGEVFVYDRTGALVNRFDVEVESPGSTYGMQPFGIHVGDDGKIAVFTQFWLMIYDQDGVPLADYYIYDDLGTPVDRKTYTLPTGLAGDGQYYYFGNSYMEEVLKVTEGGEVAGRYAGVNVTRSIFFKNDRLYVADSGLRKMVVLDRDMIKLAEYPVSNSIDHMGLYDDYFVITSGHRAYVYDKDMSLFNTVEVLPQGWQAWGIVQLGDEVAIVANNNRNHSQSGLFLIDGAVFTTKSPIQATPDPVPVVEAVVAGTAIGILGLFLGKAQGFLGGLYEQVLERLPSFLKKAYDAVLGYVQGHMKSLLFRKESKLYKVEAKERIPLFLGFSSVELLVIVAGSLLLALSYVIAKKAAFGPENIAIFLVAGVVAVVAHDIAHRYFARKYKVVTEYQFWWLGAIIMFVTAMLFGVVYALPARTIINNPGSMDRKGLGVIFLAGPLVSFGFAVFFLLLSLLGGVWLKVGMLGVSMNLLSSVYGLMPFDPMDGNKVYKWGPAIWAVAFVPILVIYLLVTIFMA